MSKGQKLTDKILWSIIKLRVICKNTEKLYIDTSIMHEKRRTVVSHRRNLFITNEIFNFFFFLFTKMNNII